MADVDWESVEAVNVQPGFVPPVSLSSITVCQEDCYAVFMSWVSYYQHWTSKHPYHVFYCRQLIVLHFLSTFYGQ